MDSGYVNELYSNDGWDLMINREEFGILSVGMCHHGDASTFVQQYIQYTYWNCVSLYKLMKVQPH